MKLKWYHKEKYNSVEIFATRLFFKNIKDGKFLVQRQVVANFSDFSTVWKKAAGKFTWETAGPWQRNSVLDLSVDETGPKAR